VFQDGRPNRRANRLERVLIVDPQPAAVRMLSELIRGWSPCEIYPAADEGRAYNLARSLDPQLIMVEHPASGLDGYALAKRIRRSDLACRMAPIIMVTAEATAAAILTARDAGLHEFLRKPYTARDLERRLEAVTSKPRDWIEAVGYIGPDRRRFNSADYAGPRKRRNDAQKGSDAGRLAQAIKIIIAAAKAVDTDLMQVRRALKAQAIELHRNPDASAALKAQAAGLANWCDRAETMNPSLKAELQTRVGEIIALSPPEAVKAA
jgi:CheY-like chemotaxis protein